MGKRILSGFLCLILVFGLFSFTATPAEAANAGVEQAIINACINEQNVDLSAYSLTKSELATIYHKLYDDLRLPWYSAYNYSYTYYTASGLVAQFQPRYYPVTESEKLRYEQRIAEIIDECTDEKMDQWQKALSVHDYIATHCAYDEALVYRRGYDMILRGTTVCTGYAEVYGDIMNRLGIPCVMVRSEGMDHCWNLIQLYGNWYHVDVTWDDPITDVEGRVVHAQFLKTDKEMINDNGYYGWVTDIKCTDTSYSDGFWNDVDNAICYLDNTTSFVHINKDHKHTIYKREEKTGKLTAIKSLKKSSINIGSGNYYYWYNGLSLWNGKLYYSTSSAVYEMDLNGKNAKKIYTHSAKKEKTYIRGIFVDDGILNLTLSTHKGKLSEKQVDLGIREKHTHSYSLKTVKSTCDKAGYTAYECSCGLSCMRKDLPAVGHVYETWELKASSVRTPGITRRICKNCGHSY